MMYQRHFFVISCLVTVPTLTITFEPHVGTCQGQREKMTTKLRPTRAFQKRLEFLHGGKLYFKNTVKIITLSYRTSELSSRGLRWEVTI